MDFTLLCCLAVRAAREEGLPSLVARTSRFCRDVLNRIACVHRVYICRFDLAGLDAWPRLSNPCGFEAHFVSSHADADSLVEQGYEDLRARFFRARDSLDAGAVALCAYRGERLAHIGWVARSPHQKLRFDVVPYRVDFEHGEACLGSVFTLPEYRGHGLAPYSMRLRLEYLRSLGYSATFAAVETENMASLRAMERVGPFTRRPALHVKLPCINYVRYAGEIEPVSQVPVSAREDFACSSDGNQ